MNYRITINLKEPIKDYDVFFMLESEANKNTQLKYNDDAFITLSNNNDYYLTLLAHTFVNFEFNQNKMSQFVSEYADLCHLKVKSINIEQLTFDQFSQQVEFTKSFNKHTNFLDVSIDKFISTIPDYEFHYMQYSEYFVDQNIKANSPMFKHSFNTELKRIKQTKSDRFVGHPIHYKIFGDIYNDALTCAKNLTQKLFNQHRLIYPYLVSFKLHHDPADLTKVNLQGIDLVEGGACFFDLSDSIYEEYNNAQMEDYLRMLANLLLMNRHQILFIIYSNNKDGRIIRLLDQYLFEIKFCVLTENLISYKDALEMVQENLEELKMDADLAFEVIKEDKTYFSQEVLSLFNIWYENYLNQNLFPQYQNLPRVAVEEAITGQISAMTELQAMIGLEQIKNLVTNYLDYQQAKVMYAQNGIQLPNVSQHMVFKGAPGTAKTSVARLIGKIMKEYRLLSVGEFYEVSRADLVDKYVGWTARNVRNIFRKAQGSILFIDEAYSLLDNKDNDHSFGDEAIAAIVQEMENRRNDIVVIFAGYPSEMDEFIKRNPGLSSRIGFHFDFKNYSNDELLQITEKIVHDAGFSITEEALQHIGQHLNTITSLPDFGNGRTMRTIVEKAILKHSVSMLSLSSYDKSLTVLYPEDFEINVFDQQNYLNFRTLKTGVH